MPIDLCDGDLQNSKSFDIKRVIKMEEKRFALAYEQGNWWAVRDGDITLWKEEVIHLLNEQQAIISRLEEENKQLLKENVFLAKQRSYWKSKSDMAVETFEIDEATEKKISELEKENERLKSELNDCAFFLYGMFGEMNDNPVVLKKYKELFDDE